MTEKEPQRECRPLRVGVVFCGGRSTRMGAGKASIEVNGKSMLDRAIAAVSVCDEVVLSVAHDPANRPERLEFRQIADSSRDGGPLTALESVASAIDEPEAGALLVTIPCDMPLINTEHVRKIVAIAELDCDDAVIVRGGGRVHPTVAAYRLSPLRALFSSGFNGKGSGERSSRLDGVAESLRCRFVDLPESCLHNVNTPDDLAFVEAAIRDRHDRS